MWTVVFIAVPFRLWSCKLEKNSWEKRQAENSFRFRFISSNSRNADGRLSTAEFISLCWPSARHVKYVNINRLTIKGGGEKLFAIYFSLNGSFSHRSPYGISMRCVRIVRSRSRSVVNFSQFFHLMFNRDLASVPFLRLFHLSHNHLLRDDATKFHLQENFDARPSLLNRY